MAEYLNMEGLAAHFNHSVRSFYKWKAKGGFPIPRGRGRSKTYNVAEVDEYLKCGQKIRRTRREHDSDREGRDE